jgi:AraC-like DNA-binding protein
MHYREFPPDARLRPFVRVCWTLSGPGAEMPPQPILPDGCTELIVHRARPFWRHHACAPAERQAPHLFVGQMLAPAVIAPDGGADVVAIRFEPFGAHAFLGIDQTETADLILDANDLQHAWLSRALARAERADSAKSALRILQDALLKQTERKDFRLNARVTTAARMMIAANGAVRIDDVAKTAGTSARNLERLFETHVGTTPKRFARVLRFQATANQILYGGNADLGFFDQAHMIKDFVTFAGTTPGQFAKTLGELTRVMLS